MGDTVYPHSGDMFEMAASELADPQDLSSQPKWSRRRGRSSEMRLPPDGTCFAPCAGHYKCELHRQGFARKRGHRPLQVLVALVSAVPLVLVHAGAVPFYSSQPPAWGTTKLLPETIALWSPEAMAEARGAGVHIRLLPAGGHSEGAQRSDERCRG